MDFKDLGTVIPDLIGAGLGERAPNQAREVDARATPVFIAALRTAAGLAPAAPPSVLSGRY